MMRLTKPNRDRSHGFACCLLLSAVLVLGIVQWSFLPLLVQSTPLSGRAILEVSGNHTSKFAAPFKYLFGDSLNLFLARTSVSIFRITPTLVRQLQKSTSERDDFFFSHRQFRAPPAI